MRKLALAALLALLSACQMQLPSGGTSGGGTTEEGTSALAAEDIAVTTLAAPSPSADTSGAEKPAGATSDKTAATPDTPAADAKAETSDGKPAAGTTPQAEGQSQPAATTPSLADQTPAEPLSPDAALCQKKGGQWSPIEGTGGHVCVHMTRDSGKSCQRKGQCQGECLAQSGTCSPITPLMGCNAILQADGTEVTLCLQ